MRRVVSKAGTQPVEEYISPALARSLANEIFEQEFRLVSASLAWQKIGFHADILLERLILKICGQVRNCEFGVTCRVGGQELVPIFQLGPRVWLPQAFSYGG